MDSSDNYAPQLSLYDTQRLHALQNEWDFQRKMTDLMEKSPAYKDYYGAALEARRSAKSDGLIAELNQKFEVEHNLRQGIKAACLAREDVETTTRIQLRILERLDRVHSFQVGAIERLNLTLEAQQTLKRLTWICTGLLIYIAYRLS